MFIRDKSELRDKFTALYRQAEHLIEGGSLDVEVKKHVHKRSNAQNNYYWLICGEVVKFLDEAGACYGEDNLPYTNDLLHEINKKRFSVQTTTKLNMTEFCEYMTKVIEYWQAKTNYFWMPSELPQSYLIQRGYTADYTKGVIHG